MFNFSFTTSHAIGNDSDISEKPNPGLFKNSQLKFVRRLLNMSLDKISDALPYGLMKFLNKWSKYLTRYCFYGVEYDLEDLLEPDMIAK